MEYLPFSWEDAEKANASLTEKINSSGFIPDIIIAVSRGGLVPARLLSDSLNVPVLYTIRISFYSSVGVRMEKPQVTQPLSVDIKGKKILIVDDISDSGRSLELAEQYIIPLNPAEIKTATIHYKPGSMFKPDFFLFTTESWVVYPWERAEFARDTGKRVEEL
jgi:hypoxanthine phosphoribosyltransferase